MTFLDLIAGDAVFIDANTFVYHFAPDPTWSGPCGQLIQRVQNQELSGYTSAAILGELAHRLMTIEAKARHGWTSGKVLQRLKKNPAIVQTLGNSEAALTSIVGSRVRIIPIDSTLVVAAAGISRQTGLLSNDALMVAAMQANSLTKLASNDGDLDGIPGITRYAPA
ncbi:MAG TPA: type II toxin-antitoxin system VapC family toxin [Gemmataceae bacterium]|nr:type II toxin-antitoxin system VapC family toxin [Gemmataceae bacterium]